MAVQVTRDGAFPVRLPGSCNFFEDFACKLDLPETDQIRAVIHFLHPQHGALLAVGTCTCGGDEMLHVYPTQLWVFAITLTWTLRSMQRHSSRSTAFDGIAVAVSKIVCVFLVCAALTNLGALAVRLHTATVGWLVTTSTCAAQDRSVYEKDRVRLLVEQPTQLPN